MVKVRVPANEGPRTNRGGGRKTRPVQIQKLNKPSSLEELHCKEFSVDERVQRALNEPRVAAMAEDFRPDSLGLITASRRQDGHLYVLDGQHRVAAARKARYDGLIATRVFKELAVDEEAGLFLTLNSTRKVEAIDRFKVRVTMGDRVAQSINNVLKRYGLHVDWASNEARKTISAIVTLEKIYHGAGVWKYGDYSELVDRTLKTIHGAYGEDAERSAYTRSMMEGLGIIHAHFGSRIDQDRLVKSMASVVPTQIAARARTLRDAKGGTLGGAAAEVIHSLYNRNLKDGGRKLPEFADVEPLNQEMPHDPMVVDPNDFVRDEQSTIDEHLQRV